MCQGWGFQMNVLMFCQETKCFRSMEPCPPPPQTPPQACASLENSNRCAHLEAPTGTLVEPLWQPPPPPGAVEWTVLWHTSPVSKVDRHRCVIWLYGTDVSQQVSDCAPVAMHLRHLPGCQQWVCDPLFYIIARVSLTTFCRTPGAP